EVLRRIDRAAPGFAAWILEDAYGRVLSREGLATRERELLSIVALAALDCPAQLKSHVRGALRLGAALDEVNAAVAIAAERISADATRRAREVVDEAARGD